MFRSVQSVNTLTS